MAESTTNTKWREIVAKYQTPSIKRAVWQLVTTLGLLITTVIVMYWSLSGQLLADSACWRSPPPGSPSAPSSSCTIAGTARFCPSRTWNDVVGWVTGILTTTPVQPLAP
jgi:hypothetical protein